jgi:hypothetical protein
VKVSKDFLEQSTNHLSVLQRFKESLVQLEKPWLSLRLDFFILTLLKLYFQELVFWSRQAPCRD